MLDRASTFADSEIVQMLKTRFVPVAIDQSYQRRQQDAEGAFYRKVATQGPRKDFQSTTQGIYIATAAGQLLGYRNNRGPDRIRQLMHQALAKFQPPDVQAIDSDEVDERYNPEPPDGGLVLRVRAKVLGGYEETDNPWRRIFQTAVSRDNLWITRSEQAALARGEIPMSVQRRIARFHLVDNTRGEPPMWRENEIRQLDMQLANRQLNGNVHLETADGQRGYRAQLFGLLETKGEKVVRFDCVASGEFWGEGQFTRGCPQGKYPLAVSFTLADGIDTADRIPPQGSRGWLRGYLP